jgi:hypothetical protein
MTSKGTEQARRPNLCTIECLASDWTCTRSGERWTRIAAKNSFLSDFQNWSRQRTTTLAQCRRANCRPKTCMPGKSLNFRKSFTNSLRSRSRTERELSTRSKAKRKLLRRAHLCGKKLYLTPSRTNMWFGQRTTRSARRSFTRLALWKPEKRSKEASSTWRATRLRRVVSVRKRYLK